MNPSRRNILTMGGAFVGGTAMGVAVGGISPWPRWFRHATSEPAKASPPSVPQIAICAPLVLPKSIWSPSELNRFLDALPDEQLLSMLKSAYTGSSDATIQALTLTTHSHDVQRILQRLVWISSNVLTYEFRDEWSIDYHALVQWLANKEDVDADMTARESTFALEREIQLKVFAQLWDKLPPQERQKLLDKIDTDHTIADKSAIAAMSGAAALAALSTTVYFASFAFYTTMSVTISSVAGFLGLTVPFAAYSTASSIIGFLSGPVGWATVSVLAVGGVALAGRANPSKMLAVVSQLHMTKVAALMAAGVDPKSVWPAPRKWCQVI
jgi:uncharacterized protein YaaW (UPF0174 family)